MAMVRAKVDQYLAPEHGGYKSKGEEFPYEGPPNENLELLEKKPKGGRSAAATQAAAASPAGAGEGAAAEGDAGHDGGVANEHRTETGE